MVSGIFREFAKAPGGAWGKPLVLGDMVSVSFAGLRSPQGRGENLNSLTLWVGGGKRDIGLKKFSVF